MAKPISLSDLPVDLARFREAQMADGRFASVEDVLRLGEMRSSASSAATKEITALRAAIAEGDASPDAPTGLFARVQSRHGLPTAR